MIPTSWAANRRGRPIRSLQQSRTFEVSLAKSGFGPVAGVDEAGRGACAGPLVIAACMLPQRPLPQLAELTDSKKLSAAKRAQLYDVIRDCALATSVIVIEAADVDRFGVHDANVAGMRRAVAALPRSPGYVLTDALRVPGLPMPYLPVIGGDAQCRCIAAASVLAKVTRDRIMVELSERFPEYGFAGHKGYGTAVHMSAVARHGASAEHRWSFRNVRHAHSLFESGHTGY